MEEQSKWSSNGILMILLSMQWNLFWYFLNATAYMLYGVIDETFAFFFGGRGSNAQLSSACMTHCGYALQIMLPENRVKICDQFVCSLDHLLHVECLKRSRSRSSASFL